VAATYNREQIRAALALTDPAISSYLDLNTGQVVQIDENETGNEQLRDQVMEGYGERYRYISGGNPAADDAAVATWLEGEGL
jgi:predicted transcriptional regulator